MKNIFLKAHAKINLNLHLIPELSDRDYYPVRFVNSQLNIYDEIKISIINKNMIEVSVFYGKNLKTEIKDTNIHTGENLAYKACELIRREFNIKTGVNIEIKKNIPVKAGLGGGSCDAAAVINGMDQLFTLNLTPGQKIKLSEKLGMDVCYCVIGGLCLVGGIGNVVIPLAYPISKIENVLLVLPEIKKPSTAWAYSIIEKSQIGKNINRLNGLLKGILMRDQKIICKNIWNDFEKPISRHFPIVKDIISILKQKGASAATLAGSGLTVFGIFENKKQLLEAKYSLNKTGFKCIKTSII